MRKLLMLVAAATLAVLVSVAPAAAQTDPYVSDTGQPPVTQPAPEVRGSVVTRNPTTGVISEPLALTGVELAGLAGIALALVGGGAALVFGTRRQDDDVV